MLTSESATVERQASARADDHPGYLWKNRHAFDSIE
jgi:hypothetical protein